MRRMFSLLKLIQLITQVGVSFFFVVGALVVAFDDFLVVTLVANVSFWLVTQAARLNFALFVFALHVAFVVF